jgi:hypothetical protein
MAVENNCDRRQLYFERKIHIAIDVVMTVVKLRMRDAEHFRKPDAPRPDRVIDFLPWLISLLLFLFKLVLRSVSCASPGLMSFVFVLLNPNSLFQSDVVPARRKKQWRGLKNLA